MTDLGFSSAFGWTYISRQAVRHAEAQMAENAQGVRDEIGFLGLHKGYADRLFPGTSVLQTRLRYIFFVPWMYQAIAAKRKKGNIAETVKIFEAHLVQLLNHDHAEGVIGKESYKYRAAQPPSLIYWAALRAWNMLRPKEDGRYYTRDQLHRAIKLGVQAVEDESLLEDLAYAFVTLPAAPAGWEMDKALSFALQHDEVKFIADRWRELVTPANPLQRALLSYLAENPVGNVRLIPDCWDAAVMNVAGKEKSVLQRAQRAASMAAVGRAVYAALVEIMREKHDKLPTDSYHRDQLKVILKAHRALALECDITAIEVDIGEIGNIKVVIQETHDWLSRGKDTPSPLLDVYSNAEWTRKGMRSRLNPGATGKEKRQEWDSRLYPLAYPLHYRWPRVQRMLADLYGQT